MRLILTNDDARRLRAVLAGADELPGIAVAFDPAGGPPGATLTVAGETFHGRARRTPGAAGTFTVEDRDGDVVVVGEAER